MLFARREVGFIRASTTPPTKTPYTFISTTEARKTPMSRTNLPPSTQQVLIFLFFTSTPYPNTNPLSNICPSFFGTTSHERRTSFHSSNSFSTFAFCSILLRPLVLCSAVIWSVGRSAASASVLTETNPLKKKLK